MSHHDEDKPHVTAADMIVGAGKTALEKVPGVAGVMKWLEKTEEARRNRRREAWSAAMAGTGTEEQLLEVLASELRGEDAELVREAVLEGARAAYDVVDESIIPAIAKLTRAYLTKRTPTRRMFRELVSMLRSLDGEEFAALMSVIPTLVRASDYLLPHTWWHGQHALPLRQGTRDQRVELVRNRLPTSCERWDACDRRALHGTAASRTDRQTAFVCPHARRPVRAAARREERSRPAQPHLRTSCD